MRHHDISGGLTSLASAVAWIDEHVTRRAGETVPLDEAVGRVLAHDAVAAVEMPSGDRAAVDAIALLADETAGAGAYNPLSFRSSGRIVEAGDPLPAGTDAVVPLAQVQQDAAGSCEIIEPVAPGSGIEPKASHFQRGARLLPAGRRLHPHDIALLAAAGVATIEAIRRPRVVCLLVARTMAGEDANGPFLRSVIPRDGGIVAALREIERDRAALRKALAAPDADLVIVAGGTGPGGGDAAAAALAEGGEVAIHGVALQPGETAGVGRTAAGRPVFLLPGAPAACLWAYELLAGRVIRRLAGRDPALPFRTREMTTARKIVSAIGMTEICPVRRIDQDRVAPLASFAAAGLGAAALADGFVIVAEGSEGVPEGGLVTVYLYEGHLYEGDPP